MTRKFDAAILDELLKSCERPEDLPGDGGLGSEAALMQRLLGAELTEHLGYEHGKTPPPVQLNRRNGISRKIVQGETGAFDCRSPRPKGQLRAAADRQGPAPDRWFERQE